MKKLFTLIIALFAIVSASMADDAITSLKLTTRINGKAAETHTIPANGFSVADITDESTTSLIIQKAEVTTTGNVSDIYFFGSLYNSDSAPKSDSWMYFPMTNNGSSWVLDMGEGVELIESGQSGKTKIFEFYVQAKNGSGSDIFYNNGEQNYKVKFTIGSGGGSSDWTVKYYAQSTATLDLTWNGTTNRNYVYNGEGIREQYYHENPGEVGSLVINGFTTRFSYNKEAGVNISSVTLQYRINVDGEEGEWNGLNGTLTKSEDIWNEEEQHASYRLIYSASNLNLNVVSAYGLEPGHNYVLEYMYQVVTTAGDYILLRQGSSDMKLAFTVTEASAPTYKGMTAQFLINGSDEINLIQTADGNPYSANDGNNITNVTGLTLNGYSVTLGGDNIQGVRLAWRIYPTQYPYNMYLDDELQEYGYSWHYTELSTIGSGELWSDAQSVDVLEICKNTLASKEHALESNTHYRFYCYVEPLVSGAWLPYQEWGQYLIKFITGDVTAVEGVTESKAKASNVWYDLSGNRLSGKPSQKGVYINAGNKVVME